MATTQPNSPDNNGFRQLVREYIAEGLTETQARAKASQSLLPTVPTPEEVGRVIIAGILDELDAIDAELSIAAVDGGTPTQALDLLLHASGRCGHAIRLLIDDVRQALCANPAHNQVRCPGCGMAPKNGGAA